MLDDVVLPLPDSFIDYREQVAVLAAAGITIPAAWTKLDRRLTDYLTLESPALSALISSVIHPDASDDRPTMRALALAEAVAAANPAALARVNLAVIDAVHRKLTDIYEPAATGIYQKAAELFDAAARDFTSAAQIIDPETAPISVIGRPESEQAAYQAAQTHAARLTNLLPPLAVAAGFAGLPGIDLDTLDDGILIALAVDTADLQRRRVWGCWLTKDGDGRTGRWGALIALGATIRALPNLKDHQPYPEPRPIEYRDETVVDQHGHATLVRRVPHDPEDDHTPQPIDPRRSGRVTTV